MKDKLVMVIINNHKFPYGTLCSVIKDHPNKSGYYVSEAETNRKAYIAKEQIKYVH